MCNWPWGVSELKMSEIASTYFWLDYQFLLFRIPIFANLSKQRFSKILNGKPWWKVSRN